MTVSTPASRRSLGSGLAKVDAPVIQPDEYDALPGLTDDLLKRGQVIGGGRPRSPDPRCTALRRRALPTAGATSSARRQSANTDHALCRLTRRGRAGADFAPPEAWAVGRTTGDEPRQA